MTRTPVEVYKGLLGITVEDSVPKQIEIVVTRFTDFLFLGSKISVHLTRFVSLFTKLVAYLESRDLANPTDVTEAIDVLDYFTSTSKWWLMTRNEPGFVLRPPSREPRNFIKSITDLQFGPNTLQRISGAAEKLFRFLKEHEVADKVQRDDLRESFISSWAILSAFACKGQGRNVISETDFETAYDILRILCFYVPSEDFKALTVIRRLGSHPVLPKAASVGFSPGFERKLNSSAAARLEKVHGDYLAEMAPATSGASRTILTNSLRFLGQLQAVKQEIERLEDEHYDSTILNALQMFENIGVSSAFLQDESVAIQLFRGLKLDNGVEERIQLLIRRLEGLVVDSTGNKDFLLQYARLVPRLVALLLLLATATKTSSKDPLKDIDLKRGLVLLHTMISD
ncbi:MAG: hypothetical protein AM325_006025 [Candidatus Thorarchaeota archaeon SMTZ1-45]|nr:MAG: hypothetical protein AM325_07775 [Candidatus Thorarchaeota archaeon SMTZ1-45]